MSRANYRNLPRNIRAQVAKPRPRRAAPAVAGQPPKDTIGSPVATGRSNAVSRSVTGQQAVSQTPAAGRVRGKIMPTNEVQSRSNRGGTVGTALDGNTGYRGRRK